MSCQVPSPFGGDLLQLAVYASIALGLLKLFVFRDWEGWWRPIVAALLPTVLIPAALTAVLNAFGMPTPLYGVDGLHMYTVVSSNDLCRNLAVAEYVYNKLESSTLSLVNTYAAATTTLTVIDGILTVVTGGAWQALDYAESALRLMGFQNWVNALTQPILAMVYIYMSLTVIWHIVVVMARVALWAPLLISVGVPLVAVRRTKDLGGVAIALAAIAVAVSHFAFLTALDVYGMALWGGAFAQNLKDAAGGLQINSTAVPYGAPQLAIFGGDGVYYIVYNNTYHASAVQKAMEENPFLTTLVDQYANNTYLKQLAEERRQEYLNVLKSWLNKTSLYAKNVTNGVLAAAGPSVGALEWGNKAMNASAWYDWLEMDVTLSVAKCNSLIPQELEGLFQMGRELNSNITAIVERAANETCAWLQKANLTDLVFNYAGRYRTLVAGYTYSLSAMWGNSTALLSRSNASGAVGLWDWAVGYGPDGEKCVVAGHVVNCDFMNVTASLGRLTYEMPNGTLTWIEPATDPVQVQSNASLQLSSGRPYPTDKIPLYKTTEICTWCAKWVNGTCAQWASAYRDWWEEYTAKKVLSRANYTLPRPYSPEPWRYPPGTAGALNVTYVERTWSISKYWVYGSWYPQAPPPNATCYFTSPSVYKYVVLLHVPQPYVRVVYYWAWLSGANINVSPSAQPTLPDTLPASEVPPDARPKDGLPADYYLWGAENAVYCSSAVVVGEYEGWKGMLKALPLVDEINREGLFASLALRNATASYYQVRQIPSGIQWLIGLVQGTPGQWAVPALEEGLGYAKGNWHGYLWHPMPEPVPSSYRLYHLYAACIVFEWNSTRWPPGGVKMLGALRLTPGREVWAVDAPFAYSNATLTLLDVTNTMLHHFLTKGFLPPAPAEVCIPVGNGSICGAPYLAGMLTGVYWGGPCPYGTNNCGGYVRLDMFPTGPWGVPLVGNFFSQEMYNTFEVAMAYGEAWKRLIFAGILVLGVFEVMGFLFGFPTPARLLYSVASDILSQLGYWMGFRIGLKAKLGRRLIQPIRARLVRASRLIAAKLPRIKPLGLPSREWLRDPRRWLWERVTRRWEEERRRQIEERLSSPGGKEEWEIRMEQKRRWREEAREALKRIYHAAQAHDVVEFARRLSPRIDAFISRVEERLAERHPTLYKLYVLTYRGQYGYLYLLAEPVIRRWEAEGKITRAEADQLRKLRAALWAAAAEAKAKAAEAEKGVDPKHLKHVLEYRERYVQYALKELELMRFARTKEELEGRLRYAASHLQRIDPKGASRLWEALEVAAEGKRVGLKTTGEVAEFLWERREGLDVIAQRAKELIAQHYAHAPLSVKDVAREEVYRQVIRTTPLLEALAKARRYAATGEGIEDVVQALEAREVRRAARAAEVELGAVRRAAERAARLEEERAGLLSKIEELRGRAETLRAELEAMRQSGVSFKELEGRQRQLEEVYKEVERLQQRLSRVEERLVEARRRLAVEAREALERAVRSYRGVLEGVKYETDPAYIELRRALLEGRLDVAYRELRGRYEREGRDVRQVDRLYQQLKPYEAQLQRAREELRAAVKEREEAIRAEAAKRMEAVTYLESLFKALPTATEEDVRRGVEMARQLGLERTAAFLEEYLRHGQVRERYASAASTAAVALGRLAGMREQAAREHQAAEERLKRVSLAEDALRRIGHATEFGQAAKAAREAGLERTALFLERWAALRRQAEERGGLEVVNRLGRALAEGRLAEEASAMAAEGKALGNWYGRVVELRPLYEEAVKEAAKAKAEAEATTKVAAELKALMEKASAESPADLIARASKLDVGELKRAAEAARRAGLEHTARYFEELAEFATSAKEGAKALAEYSKAERRLRALEAKARAELQKAEKVAEGLTALLEGREYERLAHVRSALKALDEKTSKALEGPLGRLAEVRREVELLRGHYTYEVGGPVWRELRQRGIDTLLLRAPLSAYVAATLEGSLLREAAEAFRPSFSKYEREAATTIVYLPVSEGEKLGPVISWERAVKGDARPYVEEIAETKAPTLKQAVKEYYAGRGRQYRELAYLEARAAEAVLDVHAARYFLERYAKEGRQEDLALAIALAYRAAKAYQKYQHSDLGQLAELVAEIRQRLGLAGRDVTTEALAASIQQLGGDKALKEALKPKSVEEAVKWLKAAWAAVDYRTLESRLGLTRTYTIPEPEMALEYTAKALTPSRAAALAEGKVAEEAFSVMRAYSLLREFERFVRGRQKEVAAKADLRVARALERPLPLLQTSAVDKAAKEAAARLVREAEALAQRYGLRHVETKAVLEQIKELVRVSPGAFGELVSAASTARGPFKEWARQLVAEVRRNWDSYREGWEAPVLQRLELLRRVPAASGAESPIPRELIALALWAELNPKLAELKRAVGEVSPAAVEEASLMAEAIRAIQRDLERLKAVDLERPIRLSFEALERKTAGGVERLVVDEAAELSKASRYLQHSDLRVREEAELLLKFARGEITRTQLREELAGRGGPVTEEGREAVSVERRLRDIRAELVSRLAVKMAVLKDVESLRRDALGVAYWAAVKTGLGDEKAERELRTLAAISPKAVEYAESLKLLRVLTEGLDRVVYEPELAKRHPELRDVLLERDRALKKAEELERSGDVERAVLAGLLREFAEGHVSRGQLLKAAEEKGVDLSEFSRENIERMRGMVMERVREMAVELSAYRGEYRSLREALEARLPMGLYAELAGELRVKLEEAAARAGVPLEYASHGVVEGAARYAVELGRLASRLPVEVEGVQAALDSLRRELSSIDEPKLIAELANGNYSTVERIRRRVEEVEAEVARAALEAVRRFGVRGVPPELLELAARAEFTPEELSSIRAELKAALEAAARGGAFTWPQAEYRSSIFATTDEKAARAWRRGGGLVLEEYILTQFGPKRVYILAPRNAPIEEIREALYALRGVEVIGMPKWLADWSVAEALGFEVERTDRGIALRSRVEALIDLERPLPYRREVWEALKRARPDLAREAVGVGWSVVHWEDGLAAVNAYLFLRRMARWDSFGPADVERALEEYRRRFTPAFERHLRAMSLDRLGFDVVDFLKGAYAVVRRLRGELAVYKPQDPEAYARLIWWAKRNARGSLYELLEPDFRIEATLKALNIAVKGGWLSLSEALSLFDSWRRNNDVAKWDEEALRIALRGNLRMKETEEAIKRFVESIRTSKQLEAEEVAKERLRLMEEQKRREEEMKKIRGIREARPRAKPAEEAEASQKEEAEQVKKEEAERARPEAGEAIKAERPEGAKAAVPEAEGPAEEVKPAEAERAGEEVSYIKLGHVYVKSTYMENAVVRAFAVENPVEWHHKLTPEAYLELRAGLAPFELERLEAARERAAERRRALSLLAERYGSIAVPERVRREAERRAYAEFMRHFARLASLYDPEAVEAVRNRLMALVAEWVEMEDVPNAYEFIYNVMWTWEGDPKTRNVREEWGYWLFREDFKAVKELAERYGVDAMRLWNAYRSAVDRYLDTVTSYGDAVRRAVTTVDRALYVALTAAGGVALAEALHGAVRPELVYAATAAASLALAGKYRDAVRVVKTAVENVKAVVEKAAEGVKLAVERLYEAVVETAARIVQWLGGHWRAVALIAAAAAAGLIAWTAAHQMQHALFIDHAAILAKAGFLGVGGVAEDRDALRRLWSKALEDWSLAAAGEKVEAVRALMRDKPVLADRFEQAERSAAEEAKLRAAVLKKALELRWEPTAERAVGTLVEETVGPSLKEEELGAFGVWKGVKGFLYKLHGEGGGVLNVGGIEARGLYAIIAKTGGKTIRVEVYAREVNDKRFEEVETPIGRLYRLASLSVSVTKGGEPSTSTLNFTAPIEREYRVGVELGEEQIGSERRIGSEEQKRSGLYGFVLTDIGENMLNSPDLSLHMSLGLFANIKKMYIDDAPLTDAGLSLHIVSKIEEKFPPKVFFWEAMMGAIREALGQEKLEDPNRVLEALCGGPCVDERGRPSVEPLLRALREHFAGLKELKAVARKKEWRLYVRDDIDKAIVNEKKSVAYVPRRMLFELAEAMRRPEFWLTLLEGDGMPAIHKEMLGLAVKEGYEDVAALLMGALALRYGIEPRLIKGERAAYLDAETSRVVSLLLIHELKRVGVRALEEDELTKRSARWGLAGATALIARRWLDWGMPGGRDPPKLISILAFYERSLARLYGQYQRYLKGEAERPPYLHLVEEVLKEEGEAPFYVRERILPTTAFDLRMKYLDREFKLDVERAWREHGTAMALAYRSYVLSAELDEKEASAELMVPVEVAGGVRWQRVEVRTDWNHYWVSCSGAHCDVAKRALGVKERGLDSTLSRAVIYTSLKRLEGSLEVGQWPEGVKRWMRAPLRIELLEVRDNGDVRFRIWYYRWLDTRPHQPYVDVEMKYVKRGEGGGQFVGWLNRNEAEGIYAEHLEEIHKMLEAEGLHTTLAKREEHAVRIDFTGGFRKELLRRVGYVPERAAAEPAAIKYLGDLHFEVEGRVVEFGVQQRGVWQQPYAVLQFDTAEATANFYKRLKAAGVYAEVRGSEVRLDEESYWGLVTTSGVTPEGWQRLYPLEKDQYRDLYVFKRVDAGGVYYQFVVKVGDVWRATGGWYDEKRLIIALTHSERAVLEALREAVKKAVDAELGEVGVLKSGVYYLYAYRPVLAAFEERALEARPSERPAVYVEDDAVVVKHGGVEHRVEFSLVKQNRSIFIPDPALQPALRALGVPFLWTPEGAKVYRDGLWGLLATAVEDSLRRGVQPTLPSGVSLITARPDRDHYVFRVDAEDGPHIYSVLKVDGVWTAMGGKVRKDGVVVMQHSDEKVARAHAEAHNELLARCIAEGRCAKKEAKRRPDGKGWYFYLHIESLK
ncbi:MAG: hypothetical protein QXK62_09680 [Thermoproteus sp.]